MATMSTVELPELTLRSLDATWNYARWERLPADGNRYEVINGVLYMTTAPSSFHWWITRRIFLAALNPAIDEQGLGLTVWAPIGVLMPECDPVQPDLAVILTADLHMFRDKRIYGVPALIVEILSPSNPALDTETKLAAYARAGVPEYWIVAPTTRTVTVYSQPNTLLGGYAQSTAIPADGTLVSPTLPVRAPIVAFFAGAPDPSV